jgi:hypothetical protein
MLKSDIFQYGPRTIALSLDDGTGAPTRDRPACSRAPREPASLPGQKNRPIGLQGSGGRQTECNIILRWPPAPFLHRMHYTLAHATSQIPGHSERWLKHKPETVHVHVRCQGGWHETTAQSTGTSKGVADRRSQSDLVLEAPASRC